MQKSVQQPQSCSSQMTVWRHNGKNFNIVYLPFFSYYNLMSEYAKFADTLFRVNWLDFRGFLNFLLCLATFILVGLKNFHLYWAQRKKSES